MNPPLNIRRERAIRWRRQWNMVRRGMGVPHPMTLTYYRLARAAYYRALIAERAARG